MVKSFTVFSLSTHIAITGEHGAATKNQTFGNLYFGRAWKNSQAFLKEFYEYPASLEEFTSGKNLDPASVCGISIW